MYWTNSQYPDTLLQGWSINGPTSSDTNLSAYNRTLAVETQTTQAGFVVVYAHAAFETETEEVCALRKAMRRRPIIGLELRASLAPERPRPPTTKLVRAACAWPVAIAAYRGRSGTQKASRRLDTCAIG